MSSFLFALLLTFFFFFSPLKTLPILFFAPLLTYFSSFFSFLSLLWLSFFSGLWVDLYSSGPMGENATLYLLSALVVLREKKFLLEERPWYLALFTFLFTLVCELGRWICFIKHSTGFKNLAFSLFSFSLWTGGYAIIGFLLPLLIWKKGTKFIKKLSYLRRR